VETLQTCRVCGKKFKDAYNKRNKCHACRSAKIKCASELCTRLIYKRNNGPRYCKSCLSVRENNPNWRGGRVKHHAGYLMLHTPDRGYVLEHRLVMEQHLGRQLLPNENVHHLNGIKGDNRIENLELWAVTQPKGQRVSDLVEWAEEILQRYKGRK